MTPARRRTDVSLQQGCDRTVAQADPPDKLNTIEFALLPDLRRGVVTVEDQLITWLLARKYLEYNAAKNP
jgi:hypothetical protein